MTTLREHLEAIIAERETWCWTCGDAEKHAIAALEILDGAKWKAELYPDSVWRATELRLVPDPEPT